MLDATRSPSDYEAVPNARHGRFFAVNASQSSRNQEQGAISEPSEHRSKYDGWTVCPPFLARLREKEVI